MALVLVRCWRWVGGCPAFVPTSLGLRVLLAQGPVWRAVQYSTELQVMYALGFNERGS